MRVIGGVFGGRKFYPPSNLPTRPTTDFAKTGLFNILNNHFDFEEVTFLDLFSGTGSLSYEFASRGSRRIVSIDKNFGAVDFIRKIKMEWKIGSMEVHKSDVFKFLDFNRESFDIIFAGPPYALTTIDELPEKVLSKNMLRENGWFILETSPKHSFENNPYLMQVRNYGQTTFHFFAAKPANNFSSL